MSYGFLDIAVTPSVRAAQAEMGASHLWEDFQGHRAFDRFTPNEAAFIAQRDSFYMATVSETGWPYVQHRGGAPGFVKLMDETTIAFADYRGNRQYISLGNLRADDRVSMILMDYPRRARLKIYGHIEVVPVDADPALTERVIDPKAKARPDRIFKVRLEAFDWNCPQHITPRFTEDEIARAVLPLREHLAELETENAALKAALAARD
ncbi:pyridoxamine 5'-phosphate oxidase family protein [Aquabacter cavernae]|uniref:pyridoxamine 5'-phosphate oxidase family protein n=1 Tax=Aquabacter cavernae TaxID=2496029 RepID=UPI000F8CADB4|nr:pyridoxamine 5'-phosphate oxidase family protein [Aquabacter cavernae]